MKQDFLFAKRKGNELGVHPTWQLLLLVHLQTRLLRKETETWIQKNEVLHSL